MAVWTRHRYTVAVALFVGLASFAVGADEKDAKTADAPAAGEGGLPPVDASPQHIAELIEQLGDQKYAVRERAQADLQRIGPPALDALTRALEHSDVEINMRARYLLGSIKVPWTRDNDAPQLKALLKDFDELDEDGRESKIQDLARTSGTSEIEILCRIVRYERSQKLSKRAALLIIEMPAPENEQKWKERSDVIAATLGPTSRTSAHWLRTAMKYPQVTLEAVEDWKKLIEAEQKTLKNSSSMTRPDVVSGLLRRQVDMLDALGRRDEAQELMKALVPLERGNAKSVTSLVQWLARKKAWGVIDEVATRFGSTFDRDPMLLYTLAEARLAQGKQELAQQIAAKALALSGDDVERHAVVVDQLQKQGMFRWAEQEFRRIIALPGSMPSAYRLLAEMLHDQGKEKEAGKVLQDLVDQIRDKPELGAQAGIEVGSIRSRMFYFMAEDERIQGNTAKQADLLDQAITHDATDADVLTAMWRLPDQPEAKRQQTIRRIKTAADAFRREIKEFESQNPPQRVLGASPYNQLAWLLGNTLGEADPSVADEAIKASLKSLELSPRSPGFLDTLARCYFARGDYEAAVRNQAEAAAMEPHSGQIRRQLELFQKALAEKKKKM